MSIIFIVLTSVLLIPEGVKNILVIIAVIAAVLLAGFFVYSILVMALYWIVLLLPLITFGAGVFLRFQDQMTGNIVIGISVVMGVIWILLIRSKRSNVLRRVLNSLNRSLP